ncbi:MAG: response regulator [Spirochaetes bacterium]|nr:response regulator [Spirochaetota bacterium]
MNDNSSVTILIIDDEAAIRQSYTFCLEDMGYRILEAENGRVGVDIFEREHADLVLVDLRMPEMDGLEVLSYITENSSDTPVIIVSGTGMMRDAVEALHRGAWDYILKPIEDMLILTHAVTSALEKAKLIKDNRAYQEHLENLVAERTKELEKRNRQLEISRRQIIGILSQAAEYRDFETGNHFLRVSEYSACIAGCLGWDEEQVNNIHLAAPIHDIGKIGIPDSILLKNGTLTDDEWDHMKMHCQYGKNILAINKFVKKFLNIEELDEEEIQSDYSDSIIEMAANIALNHHEYWNGEGYPLGLKGEEIPIEARITSVADVFDSLGSHRPYKEPWPEEECLKYIEENSGIRFDPDIVEIFLQNIDTIREIKAKYTD